MERATKATWAKRVERWRDSGLTAAQFAAEIGVNARTLSYWKWRLGREARQGRSRSRGGSARKSRDTSKRRGAAREVSFVELKALLPVSRVEVVVSDRIAVRVPDGFEEETLRRVLAVVGDRA